jgi:uncharacterized protein YbcI
MTTVTSNPKADAAREELFDEWYGKLPEEVKKTIGEANLVISKLLNNLTPEHRVSSAHHHAFVIAPRLAYL